MAKSSKSAAKKGGNSWCWTLSLLVILFLVGGSFYLYHNTNFVFEPAELQAIAKAAIAANKNGSTEALVNDVIARMRAKYGDHILEESEWMFNNAGGAMGSMIVLHCSFSEYIIIFGTALGTEGHTGRFLADDYFTILAGEQWAYPAGALEREVYMPGDQHHLRLGEAKQYKMPDACWALEYARGNIVAMLPFGFADAITSTLDFYTLYQTVKVSTISFVHELLKGKI